jgi:hypothetical protein
MGVQTLSMEIFSLILSYPGFTEAAFVAALALLYVLYVHYSTPLRKIPGPFLASISKLWIVQKTRGFKRYDVDLALCKKYGSIVRVAPSEVMICSPKALKAVYGKPPFASGSFYPRILFWLYSNSQDIEEEEVKISIEGKLLLNQARSN